MHISRGGYRDHDFVMAGEGNQEWDCLAKGDNWNHDCHARGSNQDHEYVHMTDYNHVSEDSLIDFNSGNLCCLQKLKSNMLSVVMFHGFR